MPELITGPITTPQEELLRAINSGDAADEVGRRPKRPPNTSTSRVASRAMSHGRAHHVMTVHPVGLARIALHQRLDRLSGFQYVSWFAGIDGVDRGGVVPSTCPSAYRTFIVPACRARLAPQPPQNPADPSSSS